jgi:hypothetical protein
MGSRPVNHYYNDATETSCGNSILFGYIKVAARSQR